MKRSVTTKSTKRSAPQMNEIFDTALAIKNRIYGNRVVLFAPLYIGESCCCAEKNY